MDTPTLTKAEERILQYMYNAMVDNIELSGNAINVENEVFTVNNLYNLFKKLGIEKVLW